MLPNTKFLHSFGLTYVAYFWFDLFNSHHKQMGKLELNCDQIRKFYIMLMGGWGSICWVNTEEALPIVVLDKEDKCCRQICSTYFPQSSLFQCLEKRTQVLACPCLIFSSSLICLWRAFCVGKVRICIDTRKLCRQQHRKRYTLKHLSHNTTWERGSIMWKCGVGILYEEAGTVDGIENNPWHIAQIRGYPQ